ncbi:MAG TPA: zf-HC2 domain-containing protein [Solirubrobacteraceae bacterium]|nr:zf-HC2 domain-containing protein [Solirubrobacteraceae bacterium]
MTGDVEHLTCKEFVEVLTDYLEDALDPAERADVERHIVICRGCSNYVEQMRSTIDLLGRMGDDAADGAHSEKLLGLFRAWRAGGAPT